MDERIYRILKRRARIVGIFPNDASITRLVGDTMLEKEGEGA